MTGLRIRKRLRVMGERTFILGVCILLLALLLYQGDSKAQVLEEDSTTVGIADFVEIKSIESGAVLTLSEDYPFDMIVVIARNFSDSNETIFAAERIIKSEPCSMNISPGSTLFFHYREGGSLYEQTKVYQ